jgi:hypothetical protein
VATDMDAPNPDSGEEWFHTNTQLFNVLDAQNRFKGAKEVSEPWNAGPERLRVQRRVPPYLADRDLTKGLEPRGGPHPA